MSRLLKKLDHVMPRILPYTTVGFGLSGAMLDGYGMYHNHNGFPFTGTFTGILFGYGWPILAPLAASMYIGYMIPKKFD